MKTTGLIVLIVGIFLTIFTSYQYFTTEEVLDIGEIEITKEEPKKVSWSPWVGVAVIITGAVILWQSNKKSA